MAFPPDGQFVALAEADGVSSDYVFQLGQIVDAPTIRSRRSPSFAVSVASRLPSFIDSDCVSGDLCPALRRPRWDTSCLP